MNCSTILWVSVSQGQLLGNMSPTEVCGSLTKTVKPSFILGSSQWPIQTLGGEGGGGLGGHPDPEIRVWGVVSKKIYWPFWPQFGLKIGGLPPWICHCLYEMNSSVTNIHVISKVSKPKQFYLCNADITPSPFGIQQWAPRLSCLAEKI